MGRRWVNRGPCGERYCGDRNHKEVHDLDHETPECHVDKFVDRTMDTVPFRTLEEAHLHGYHDCPHCFKLPWVRHT